MGFKRRIFLRGLGGACVAAPFLGSVMARRVKAEAPTAPKRLIVMFTHYGCLTNRFFPVKSHGTLTAEDLQGTTLRHLAPYVDRLLLPRGVRAMNEWTAGLLRGQGNDPHTQVVGSYFTCQPVTPNSDDPFSFEEETKFLAMPVGPSLDHIIAQQLSPGGVPLFLRVGNRNEGAQSGISYSAAGTPYAGAGTPSAVFSELTGLFRDGDALSPDSYQAVKGKSVLDLVRDDLETLERFDMSQADKQKLAAWKELLDQTGTVVASAQCNEEVASVLGATAENTAAFGQTSEDTDVLTHPLTDTMDGADVYSSVAVLAAVCNANPVIVLKYPGNYVFKGLGISYETHVLSHRVANANMDGRCVTDAYELLATIDDFYARKFARLVAQLSQIDEGDGKLLDNTAAVCFQELSDGNAHNLNNIPIVQVGSAGGYFKTGCAVNVDDGSADMARGNSETGCEPADPNVPLTSSTGTDPSVANAPINKYFCNLMNALGVKAGADGFPLAGGTEAVTHFGMYDRTEDYIGGGTNPAMIHDPGEFTELKANG
jgi:hypothetical protein